VSTSWVAGVVRAKALAGRRLGAGGARALAACHDLPGGLTSLHGTPYGHDVRPGADLAGAQHSVGASLLWNARVLAGWLPREGADVVRLLAAGFEVANLDEHLARLAGEAAGPTYRLGSLETAWSRLSATSTLAGVGEVLGTSGWRLRGLATRREYQLGLRLAWADAVAGRVPSAAAWARSGAALLVLREVVLEGRRLTPPLARRAAAVLGPAFVELLGRGRTEVVALRSGLPAEARWTLEGLDSAPGAADLWRAETDWWRRVEDDGFRLLRGSGYDQRPVVGALAVLAVDAWRVRAALEAAVRGGSAPVVEAFDGVA
jgi:hypothetical protein